MKTDTELKMALAKMLPEKLTIEPVSFTNNASYVRWLYNSLENHPSTRLDLRVCDTELLHVCWLVEKDLDVRSKWLWTSLLDGDWSEKTHATWQQRATALCKVKGIE